MSKCVLQHCEFQHGGQCCLVCPKGKAVANEQKQASKRILSWCRKMKKILRYMGSQRKKTDEKGLPRGVSICDGKYVAYIGYNGQHTYLITTTNLDKAIRVRADAEKAKQNGVFPEWLRSFREEITKRKNGKRTAKKGDTL